MSCSAFGPEYVDPVDDKELVENAINGALTGLDPHSSYMNAKAFKDMQIQTKGEFGGLGIEVSEDKGVIKVVSPIDDTPAARGGIKPGDIITALDGKTLIGMSLNDAVDKMRGPPNSKIVLTIKRQDVEKPLEVPLIRETIKIQVVKSRMEPNDIGYIRLSQFTEQADAGIKAAVKALRAQNGGKLRGLVLDLRNNPGGLLDQAVSVSSDFIDQGEIVSTRARHPEDSQRWDAKGDDILKGAPLVVLDQRRLGLRVGNRVGRAAGSPPSDPSWHWQLRQGVGADRDPATRQWRHAADHRALLYSVRPVNSGPGHHARRAGAGNPGRAPDLRRRARGGLQQSADQSGWHRLAGAAASQRPAPDRQANPGQATRGFPEVRSGQAR